MAVGYNISCKPKTNWDSLRNKFTLVIPRVNTTTFGQRSLRFYGAKLWNELPNSYKDNMSLKDFKNLLNSWDGPQCRCAFCKAHLH